MTRSAFRAGCVRRCPNARIAKVEGHSADFMACECQIRSADDFAMVWLVLLLAWVIDSSSTTVIDVRRVLGSRSQVLVASGYHVHRFFVAVSRAVVHTDGKVCAAPDPLVWSEGRSY